MVSSLWLKGNTETDYPSGVRDELVELSTLDKQQCARTEEKSGLLDKVCDLSYKFQSKWRGSMPGH